MWIHKTLTHAFNKWTIICTALGWCNVLKKIITCMVYWFMVYGAMLNDGIMEWGYGVWGVVSLGNGYIKCSYL